VASVYAAQYLPLRHHERAFANGFPSPRCGKLVASAWYMQGWIQNHQQQQQTRIPRTITPVLSQNISSSEDCSGGGGAAVGAAVGANRVPQTGPRELGQV